MPQKLQGCTYRIKEGPVGFNLESGCEHETKPGRPAPRSVKGFHICTFCHKLGHSFVVCRQKPRSDHPKLSGWLQQGGMFEQVRTPSFDVQILKTLAKGLNASTLRKLGRRQDSQVEKLTWEDTRKEVERLWVWVDSSPGDGRKMHRYAFWHHARAKVEGYR